MQAQSMQNPLGIDHIPWLCFFQIQNRLPTGSFRLLGPGFIFISLRKPAGILPL